MRQEHPRRNSLGVYLHAHFIAEKLSDRSPHTVRKYKAAVSSLCMFVGCDITLPEINDALMERFQAWLRRQGMGAENARKSKTYVRAIVRHARPGTCPKQSGRRPHETFAVGLDDDRWDCPGSLWRFFRDVYHPERMVGCADVSIQQHVIVLRRLCRYLGRAVLLKDLSDELVTSFMQSMLNEGYSRATVNRSRGAILAVWRYAYRKKLVDKPPFVDKLKEYRRLPKAWTLPELERLLSACAATPGMIGDVPAADYWPAMILVMYDSGLRKGAVLSMEREDLDLGTGWLTVPADNQKQKAEQRFLLSEQTIGAIRRLWPPRHRLLFYWPWNPRGLWTHFKRILTRAGLPNGRKDAFHRIRKTTASHICKAAGIDAASRQLGHSGEYVTKLYVDPTIAQSAIDGVVHLPRPKLNGH